MQTCASGLASSGKSCFRPSSLRLRRSARGRPPRSSAGGRSSERRTSRRSRCHQSTLIRSEGTGARAEGKSMPTIAYFLGIAVSMYYRDHIPPHTHVEYQGFEALVAIDDARILRGRLPPTVMLIIRQWVTLRREALTANWLRAREHQALERIAGPDDDDN